MYVCIFIYILTLNYYYYQYCQSIGIIFKMNNNLIIIFNCPIQKIYKMKHFS